MVAPGRKRLAASRRRIDEEGEDEDGSVAAGLEDDSMSETSAISDADEDADAEGSEVSDTEVHQTSQVPQKTSVNGRPKALAEEHQQGSAASKLSSFAAIPKDTAAMMNGLSVGDNAEEAEEIHFDDLARATDVQAVTSIPAPASAVVPPVSNITERRRQEHEEYRKRRDADPSFVPNRGGFFMHDHRSLAPGPNGFRPFGRGRGRGRGVVAGPLLPARYEHAFVAFPPGALS